MAGSVVRSTSGKEVDRRPSHRHRSRSPGERRRSRRSDDPARKNYTIPPERFRLHLRRLREAGWTFLSLSELLSRKGRFDELPPKVIVVTFDDAYRSFFEKALPILREEGVKATLSVISSFIDAPPRD